jgi:hypothetical protein
MAVTQLRAHEPREWGLGEQGAVSAATSAAGRVAQQPRAPSVFAAAGEATRRALWVEQFAGGDGDFGDEIDDALEAAVESNGEGEEEEAPIA